MRLEDQTRPSIPGVCDGNCEFFEKHDCFYKKFMAVNDPGLKQELALQAAFHNELLKLEIQLLKEAIAMRVQ